jgi:phytoene desaturase
VLEALDQPGGRARVFRRDGFTFDAGPTVITAPYLLDELFTLAGRAARLLRAGAGGSVLPDPLPRRQHFDYVGDEERLLAQIEAMSPRDVDGLPPPRRARGADLRRRLHAARGPAVRPRGRHAARDPGDDAAGELPQRVRAGVALHPDERLRQAFTFEPLLVGGNPFTTTSIYLLIHWLERKWGVHFAMGGTTAIVAALVRLLEELGVEVRLNAPVEEIEVEGGRARGGAHAGGRADRLRRGGQQRRPVARLLAHDRPRHRRRHTDRRLRRGCGSR